MSHHHNHEHDHCCHHVPESKRALAWSFWLIFTFMFVEWVTSFLVHSLSLMADAGHMTNDAFSLALAFFAVHLTEKRPQIAKYLTLVNGLSLAIVAALIILEAIRRFYHPEHLIALPMIIVATLGLIVNIIVAKIIHTGDQENLNIQAAYWHVLADMFGSVIAIIAGLCAYFLNWQWVDPVASTILSIIILRSGLRISRTAYQALFH